MAKTKGKKSSSGGVNSHVRARMNYLSKAAAYLQPTESPARGAPKDAAHRDDQDELMLDSTPTMSAYGSGGEAHAGSLPQLARVCISQMRGVSQKAQLRLPTEQKRAFCKRCDTLLTPGRNCTQEVRNPSRGGRKPWAEVRIVRCDICGTEKRFPLTDRRSRKLSERGKRKEVKHEESSNQKSRLEDSKASLG